MAQLNRSRSGESIKHSVEQKSNANSNQDGRSMEALKWALRV